MTGYQTSVLLGAAGVAVVVGVETIRHLFTVRESTRTAVWAVAAGCFLAASIVGGWPLWAQTLCGVLTALNTGFWVLDRRKEAKGR